MNKFLVVLGGPTASGKTSTGIELAKHFNTEIISADSRQIYKETSIGTAVPDQHQLTEVTHHFIQTISLKDHYNASMFETEVLQVLRKLFKVHDVVMMVGGSGMYINAVCDGIDELPAVDTEIRSVLAKKFEDEGIESIRNDLRILDPLTYSKIDLKNPLRILKALEVTIQTGRPYSGFLTHSKKERDFQVIRLAIDLEREDLYNRINMRVDEMIRDGLIEEAESLIHLRHTNVLKTVGYKEIFQYFDNHASLDEAIDLIKRNSRKYARKQITWFRKDNIYPWYHPQDISGMIAHCEKSMKN